MLVFGRDNYYYYEDDDEDDDDEEEEAWVDRDEKLNHRQSRQPLERVEG